VEGGGGVEAAREGDADLLAEREGFEDDGHKKKLLALSP
jgi:hypothetical protein